MARQALVVNTFVPSRGDGWSVAAHAIERYRLLVPAGTREMLLEEVECGEELSPELVAAICGRHQLRDKNSAYNRTRDGQGIVVRVGRRIVTVLRLGFTQRGILDGKTLEQIRATRQSPPAPQPEQQPAPRPAPLPAPITVVPFPAEALPTLATVYAVHRRMRGVLNQMSAALGGDGVLHEHRDLWRAQQAHLHQLQLHTVVLIQRATPAEVAQLPAAGRELHAAVQGAPQVLGLPPGYSTAPVARLIPLQQAQEERLNAICAWAEGRTHVVCARLIEAQRWYIERTRAARREAELAAWAAADKAFEGLPSEGAAVACLLLDMITSIQASRGGNLLLADHHDTIKKAVAWRRRVEQAARE